MRYVRGFVLHGAQWPLTSDTLRGLCGCGGRWVSISVHLTAGIIASSPEMEEEGRAQYSYYDIYGHRIFFMENYLDNHHQLLARLVGVLHRG